MNITSSLRLPEFIGENAGDNRVCVAVIDGPIDLEHSAFDGARIRVVRPFWQKDSAPNHAYYSQHATHVASVIFGQPHSDVEGIVPRCTGISIPLLRDVESTLCPLQLARAIDLARDCGADIIHVASCQPTPTGTPDRFVERSVRACVDQNVLVVAPAGNDRGECWCVPAAIPGVLAVGAIRDDGQPFQFSNRGGIYQKQGVLAPGENILGATPGGGTRKHKGTSCAAPIVSGLAAILMSRQVSEIGSLDAAKVREAILESALTSSEIEDVGSRLRGTVNVDGAIRHLFGPRGRARSTPSFMKAYLGNRFRPDSIAR